MKRLVAVIVSVVMLLTTMVVSVSAANNSNKIVKKDNKWICVDKDGKFVSGANDIYKNDNGWWKTTNGVVTFKETGIFKNEYGWWRVENSKVNFKANDIYKNQYGWWKTTNGKVTFKENGVFKNNYGWWRVANSKVDFNANSIYKNAYGWWKTTNGKVTFDETGIFKNENGLWYVNNSKVDFNKNGNVSFNGKSYLVTNGKAEFINDNLIDKDDLEILSDEGTISVVYDESGNVIAVNGNLTDKKVLSTNDASDLLNSAKPLFGDKFNASVEEITTRTTDKNTNTEQCHYSYTPSRDGVPVLGGQIIISTDGTGSVTGLVNTYDSRIDNVNTNPVLSSQKAERIAIDILLNNEVVSAALRDMANASTDTLTILQERLQASLTVNCVLVILAFGNGHEPSLAYEVTITNYSPESSEDSFAFPYFNITYYISANDEKGLVLYQTDNMKQNTIKTKDLRDNTREIDVINNGSFYEFFDTKRNIVIKEPEYCYPLGPTIKSADSPDAVSALANMSAVYDYYHDNLNHLSYDNKGSRLYISINNNYWINPFDKKNPRSLPIKPVPMENAAWGELNGLGIITFGNRGHLHAALDICAHEFTHGVIGNINGLIAPGQAKALDESYSDILGNIIEGKVGSDQWLLGEDSDSGTTRDMKEPSKFNQPDHMKDYYKCDDEDDDGGKHTNCGIFNHAAYLMMSDSRTSNISRKKWAKVFYNSLYDLPNTASFTIARDVIVASAQNLKFNDNQIQAIKDAFDAVGILEMVNTDYSPDESENDSPKANTYYDDETDDEKTYFPDPSLKKEEPLCLYHSEYKGFNYTFNDTWWSNNYIIIEGYSGINENVVIPEEIRGYPVRAIGEDAFANNTNIKSVQIPNTVQFIYARAFSGCSRLASINLPKKLIELRESAFKDCVSLTSINLPKKLCENVIVGNYSDVPSDRGYHVFEGCVNLKSFSFEQGVDNIPSGMFSYTNINSITIPNSVKMIGAFAFSNCEQLEEVLFENNSELKSIESFAFSECPVLKRITLPDSIEQIGGFAFNGDKKLTSLVLPSNIKELHIQFSQGTTINTFSIPASLKYAERAFEDTFRYDGFTYRIIFEAGIETIPAEICLESHVESVYIPNTVKSIGEKAFADCGYLKSIFIPNSVKNIADDAFVDCDNLVIQGHKGSTAELYAAEKGFIFDAI